jgi:AcrR family transcriptional regulator
VAVKVQRMADDGSRIFGVPVALPRGPHRLSREEVAAAQRARLLAAVAGLVAEKGYAAATITEIARRAGVSPNVFYEHFADKEECFLAAYDVFARALLERIAEEIAPTVDWHDFISAAAGSYLRALEAEREAARAFLLEMDGAGPGARTRRRAAFAAFAAVFRERHEQIRARDPSLGALPDSVFLGLVHGMRALVCDALDEAPGRPLTELTPTLLYWVTATIQGAADANAELGHP